MTEEIRLLKIEAMESNLLTIEETAKYLRISRATVYNLMSKKELKPVKIGGRTLFDKKDLDQFIEDKKEQ